MTAAMTNSWPRIAKRIRVPMGFLFAAVFLYLARPTLSSLAWSLILVVGGLWLRGYASGYVKKNSELTITGPYAYTRNPLYLGSILIALGFAVASRSLYILIALVILFAAIYVPVIRAEEEFLNRAFAGFGEYCNRVPRLIPRLRPGGAQLTTLPVDQLGSFSTELYRKHREYNAVIGAAAIYLVLLLRLYFDR
jgi:hypothetical protein